MTVKNFDFAARKAAKKTTGRPRKDIPFQLEEGGPFYHVRGDMDDDSIEAVSATFVRAQAEEDKGAVGQAASVALFRMLHNVFTEDTARALWARIEEPDRQKRINFDQLGEVVEWAIEQHAGRPTTSPRT